VLEGDVRSVAIDPNYENVVYAGTEPVHSYRSEDGGDGWEELTSLGAFAISESIRIFQSFVIPRDKHPEEIKKRWWFPRPPSPGSHNRHIYPSRRFKNYLPQR
jgi:hypothetical protein